MRAFTIIILLILLLSSVIAVTGEDEDIVLIPENPVAGKKLIFYLPSINVSANGYVICENSNVHLVKIRDRFGQITLNEDDYGEAVVKIFEGNNTYTKTFDVKPFLAGELVIETPSSILIDTDATIKIASGARPAEGAIVTFKSLAGRSFSRVADGNGEVTVSFDEEGPWEINAEFYGVFTLATIKVLLPPIEIVFSENIEANEEMTISIGSLGDVTITKDEITWTYRTDANGDLYFTPPWPGKYSIYVKTDKQEGIKTFITISETSINIYDYEKAAPATDIKENQFIKIVVVDSSNVPVSDADEVFIYCDNMLWDDLPLSDGSVVWRVDKEATVYRFEFEAMEGYLSSEVTVYGIVEESLPFGDIAFYAVLVIIILVIIAIFIHFLRTGRIHLPKGLSGKKIVFSPHGKRLE